MWTMTWPLADESRVIFLNEGTHTFTLRSRVRFKIYFSPYTSAFGGWAFVYKHHEERFNNDNEESDHIAPFATSITTHPIPNAIDIIMTRGPAKGILDRRPEGGNVGWMQQPVTSNTQSEAKDAQLQSKSPKRRRQGHPLIGGTIMMMMVVAAWEDPRNRRRSRLCGNDPKKKRLRLWVPTIGASSGQVIIAGTGHLLSTLLS